MLKKHGGPLAFGFWKSILIGLSGVATIVLGLWLFEKSIIATLVLVCIGSLIILIASEAGRGKMRGFLRDPHSDVLQKPGDGRAKDMPFNPWDEVSKDKR